MFNQSLGDPDLKRIWDAVNEISFCHTRIEAEKELIRDNYAMLKEDFDLKPKDMRKIVKIHHDQNLEQLKDELDEVEESYKKLKKANAPKVI